MNDSEKMSEVFGKKTRLCWEMEMVDRLPQDENASARSPLLMNGCCYCGGGFEEWSISYSSLKNNIPSVQWMTMW